MTKYRSSAVLLLLIFFLTFNPLQIYPQPESGKNAAQIKLALDKLNVLGSVLYIAAHPDDENTAFLAYCASGKLFRTGYLSLTRGDGGQNLLGSEQGEELSVIRTEELMAARKIDGAEQFFSRAIDFGYSKNADETLNIWGKQKILSDVVWVIRKFRPDVIVLRFPGDGTGGHGNHTASAILAKEAFKIANDPAAFPEQLKYVKPWQPKRLFWNAWTWRNAKIPAGAVSIDLGGYNPLLGKSYTEIAALSRSMHKSQGFGSSGRRGESINYFVQYEGTPVKKNLFEGIDTGWKRITGSVEVSRLLKKADAEFNPEKPSAIVPLLLQAYSAMQKLHDGYWKTEKLKELIDVIRQASGLWLEALSSNYYSVPGGSVKIKAGIVNRSDVPFVLKKIIFKYGTEKVENARLEFNNYFNVESEVKLPPGIEYTQPYWLRNPHKQGTYTEDKQQEIGRPDNSPPLFVDFVLGIGKDEISYKVPVIYGWTDPVTGENYRPFEVRPALSINLDNKVCLFPDDSVKQFRLTLKANADNVKGKLKFRLDKGWEIIPSEVSFNLEKKNSEQQFLFNIKPPLKSSDVVLSAFAETNYGTVDRGIKTIDYPHIPARTLFPLAEAKLIRLDVKKAISNIGYIMGAGDVIPEELKELGYNVHLLSDDDLDNSDLTKYDAIIAGVRAYNTRNRLAADQQRLLDYVKDGGTYVVQYNNSFNLVTKDIGPYSLKLSHDRVTVEDAPVEFTDKNSPLLNFPDKITQADFKGWIQERGLYFANSWDPRYRAVIESNDPGESPLKGGLLFTNYGKGIFIYTGYSWFRQLPAGVPGAFRIFINLISSGKAPGQAN